jgi:tryptophanase
MYPFSDSTPAPTGRPVNNSANPNKPKGLKMVHEPEYLRFFQARFELL